MQQALPGNSISGEHANCKVSMACQPADIQVLHKSRGPIYGKEPSVCDGQRMQHGCCMPLLRCDDCARPAVTVNSLMWLPLQSHTGTSLAEAVQDVAEHVPAAVQQLADSSLEAVDQVQEAVSEALMPQELAERRRIRKQEKDRWGTELCKSLTASNARCHCKPCSLWVQTCKLADISHATC